MYKRLSRDPKIEKEIKIRDLKRKRGILSKKTFQLNIEIFKIEEGL